MLTSPWNDSHCPKLCLLRCTPITNTPSKSQFLALHGPGKPPAQKFGNFSQCMHAHTDSHLLFQKWLKSVQIGGENGHVDFVSKKFWHPKAETLGWFPPPHFLYESAALPLTYIPSFIQIHSFFGSYNQKTFHNPQSECNIGFSSL